MNGDKYENRWTEIIRSQRISLQEVLEDLKEERRQNPNHAVIIDEEIEAVEHEIERLNGLGGKS